MHTRVLVRMESNAFRLKTFFFFIDKVTASNGKSIFGVNFTYNTTGFETMYVLKVWHSSRLCYYFIYILLDFYFSLKNF